MNSKFNIILLTLLISMLATPFVVSGSDIPGIAHISENTTSPEKAVKYTPATYNTDARNFNSINSERLTAAAESAQSTGHILNEDSISVDASGDHYWENAVSISGTATDARDESFPGIDVYLFLNKSQSSFSIGNSDDTVTTNPSGQYSFSYQFLQSDIGTWNWTVWYPDQDNGDPDFGIDCFDCAKVVGSGEFTVYDTIQFSTSLDSATEIGPNDPIEFTASIVLTNGNPVPALVRNNFQAFATISYDNGEPDLTNTTSFTSSSSISFSEEYSGTSDAQGTIDILLQGSAPYYQIDGASTSQESFIIDTNYVFTLDDVQIGASTYTDTDLQQNQFFNRNSQTVTISGKYNSSAGVDPATYTGVTISFVIRGGGLNNASIDFTTTTDGSGAFTGSFTLDPAVFTNPAGGNVVIDIINDNPDGFLDDATRERVIRLKGQADSFQSVADGGPYTDLYFSGDGTNFLITGTVVDENGRGADGVRLILHVTNQTSPGGLDGSTVLSTTGDPGVFGLTANQLTTSSTGTFSLSFNLPDLAFSQETLTVNITISEQQVGPNYRWENLNKATSSVFSFDWLDKSNIDASTINFTFNDGVANPITTEDVTLLNTTYANTYQDVGSNYYFNITIRDEFNRVPYGITVRLDIDEAFHTSSTEAGSQNTSILTVNTDNNGIFIVYTHDVTSFDVSQFYQTHNAQFRYQFFLAENIASPITGTAYGQDVTIYGPYNQGLSTVGFTEGVHYDFLNVNEETQDNLIVEVDHGQSEIDGLLPAIANIRNVTIQWRVNSVNNFTGVSWNYDFMNYISVTELFQFQFLFSNYGNGYYFQIIISFYDLAGHGLDSTGTINGGNQWTGGLPDYNSAAANAGYDASVTNEAILNDEGSPFALIMGDNIIRSIDVDQGVTINGNSIQGGHNITTLDDDLVIVLSLPSDGNNYASVNISYRFLTNLNASGTLSLDNIVFDNPSYITMAMLSTTNTTTLMRFSFTISASELAFGTFLDFYFNYTDGVDNSESTQPFISSTGEVNPSLELNLVVDKTPPVTAAPNNFSDQRISGRSNSSEIMVIWTNETRSDFNVTYSFEDGNGEGITDVIINWFVNGSSIANFTQFYMQDGVVIFTNSSFFLSGVFTMNLTLPAQFFQSNTVISYEIEVLDGSSPQNLALFNDQDGAPLLFSVVDPPVEPVPTDQGTITSVVVSTDENGNVVTSTIVSVIGGSPEETNNNALWIITGFIGILGLLTLYYQRHNIKEILQRRQRRKIVEGTLNELNDEIKRLGAEGKYRRAILLIWEAIERVSREILQAPRRYNQTAKEFAAYLSTVTIVDRDTLLTISSNFQSARYGKDDPSKDEFDDAVKAYEITIRTIIETGARARIADDDEDW